MSVDGPPATGSFQPAASPSLVGQVLDGRYRITKKLGEGGMGEVYAAEHIHIDKKFAIKLLKAEIVSNAEAVARFRQEALKSSEIKHRNIIAIEDFNQLPDGRIYMCMELLNGAALNDLIQGPMGADRLLNILIQTGHGLAAAHARGIVHRDMKPENIFVTVGPQGEDVPKLLDFGIAKVSGNDGQNHLTRTGTIFGTPFYMAPEQALGNPVDARTDIYAMGVIMYECFAGSLPFQGESFMGILTQHITTEPENVAQRAAKAGRPLPAGLAEVITRCMQKNPGQRFQTMDELVNQLVAIYRGIAGPGMSTYMEAFPVGSAQHMAQPTPGPLMRPPVSGPHGATLAVGTAQPSGGYAPPSGGYAPPGSQPMPVAAIATAHQTGSGLYAQPKKSKLGLIIALVAVLVVGAGVAVAVVLTSNSGGGGGGSGSGSASGSQVASGSGSSNPAGTGSGSEAKNDPWANHGGNDTGSATKPPDTVDPGTNHSGNTGSGSNETVPPPVEAKVVVVKVHPPYAIGEAWVDGKMVDNDLPAEVKVIPGHTVDVTIKAKGFKDQTVSVDGSKEKVTVKLERMPGPHHPKDPTNPTNPTNPVHTPPPPGHPDCSTTIVNPKDKHCINQYCEVHATDPRCDAE